MCIRDSKSGVRSRRDVQLLLIKSVVAADFADRSDNDRRVCIEAVVRAWTGTYHWLTAAIARAVDASRCQLTCTVAGTTSCLDRTAQARAGNRGAGRRAQ